MYDLVLKGGNVIDPAQNLRGALDVAVENGKIARVAANIPASEARRVIQVKGKTVTAGLIDLHTHVFDGVAANGVHPDIAGVHAGVTTVVDAGSSGCATFSAFPRHILPKCETEVIPLLERSVDRNVRATLARTAELLRVDSAFLQQLAEVMGLQGAGRG